MPQILVRHLEEDLVLDLKSRARRNQRSLQGEVAAILEQAIAVERACRRFGDQAAELRERLADRPHTDSAELLAADRAR